MRRILVARDVEAAVKGGAVFAAGGGGWADHGRMLGTAAVWMLDAMGLSGLAERFKDWGALQAVERLNLDGLLALWHPSATN